MTATVSFSAPPGVSWRRFRWVEIELHLRAHRVVAEDLPDAGADLAIERMLDPLLLQARDGAFEVRRAERDVVDDAGAILGQAGARDVQDRVSARVEPSP